MGIPDHYHPMKMSPTSDKVCMVCGDKALGYNFNAVTCESCKAFFRRNALSSKGFTCPFNETCEVTIVTRRFCQRCRLEKCFRIGMRKEYIMSDEDKILKRKKIEQNRAKRKSKTATPDVEHTTTESLKTLKKIKTELPTNEEFWGGQDNVSETGYTDSSPYSSCHGNASPPNFPLHVVSPTRPPLAHNEDAYIGFHESQPNINDSHHNSNNISDGQSSISSTTSDSICAQTSLVYPTKDSSSADIVSFIVDHPQESGRFLNVLMPTQKEAMEISTRIINSQKDAIRLIGHLIGSPGDALKIISKIMNSPFDALDVFTKFMGSPNDSLEIIAKCVHSPADVLQFIQQLMRSPENAVETVNTFLNSPAEAMRMLNDLVITSMVDSTTKTEPTNWKTSSSSISKVNDEPSETFLPTPIPPPCTELPTTDFTDDSVQPNSLEAIISDAIHIEYNRYNKEPIPSRELNDAETAKLNELIVAYKTLFLPLDEDISVLAVNRQGSDKMEKNPQHPQLLTLINLTAIAVKRLIKMVKKINAFKNMCQEDQVALLKGGCTEMMILRSIMQYDIDHSIWNIPHSQQVMSSIKSDILKLASNNVFEEYENFIRSFDSRLRKDENIILIMSAIILFTPNRPKTVHSDVLVLEQNSYFYLLRRYLESVYPGCEAKSLYLKLMQKINDLHRLKDVIIAVYLDVNPNQVEPLLREIFDIKNC